MPKQVSGFQASDGAFFTNQNDANLYETRKDLETAAKKARTFHETDNVSFETLLLFIEDNAATVQAYCKYYLTKYNNAAEPIDDDLS